MTLKDLDLSILREHDITSLSQPHRKKAKYGITDYLYIGNIPASFKSADCRFFFKDFLEKGAFKCFHYRHRPEKQIVKTKENPDQRKSDILPNTEHSKNDILSNTEHSKSDVLPNTEHSKNDILPNSEQCGSDILPSRECYKDESLQKRYDTDANIAISNSKLKDATSTCCCIVSIYREHTDAFVKKYHGKEWRNRHLTFAKRTVNVRKLKLKAKDVEQTSYMCSREKKGDQHVRDQELYEEDVRSSIELNPPEHIMPNGNVGTSANYFHKLIGECKMPASLINTLDLDFPRSRKSRAYSSVPPSYQEKQHGNGEERFNERTNTSDAIHFLRNESGEERQSFQLSNRSDRSEQVNIQSDQRARSVEDKHRQSNKSKHSTDQAGKCSEMPSHRKRSERGETTLKPDTPSSDSGGSCGTSDEEDGAEDWERHLALHDDVDNQSRPKERLFEEDIELKWEKGGSGLVFYTDAYYWSEMKGKDFDEDTVDDWDVDYSVYYQDGGGDKPARDQLQMRIEQRRREGKEDGPSKASHLRRQEKRNREEVNRKFAAFENHSKAFGSRILKQQGWTEGTGVGSSREGIREPIDPDGRTSRDRLGLGYRGERLDRSVNLQKREDREIRITTKYDKQDGELLNTMRCNGPQLLKYRSSSTVTKPKKDK